MAGKKILVVFGATGNQGGSVVRSILSDPKTAAEYTVRAVTRDPSKPAAQELAALGAEVVAGDLDDEASLEKVIAGADSVFSVTNFWEKVSAEVEIKQGKNVADASKKAGVQHLIWSSLLNVTKLSGGKLDKVAHFDSKAEVEEYIRSIGIPASFFLPGFFMSNLPGKMVRPSPQTGAYTLALPIPTNSPIPLIDIESDTGKFVKGILLNREKVLGQRIYGATAYVTPTEIINEFKASKPQDSTGAVAVEIPGDVFKGFLAKTGAPPHIQEEMLQNMQLIPQFGYYGGASFDESHSILVDPLTTWKEYIAKTPVWAELK
ncbi:hypothetical protein G7Y89_g4160 [Cudoniella acicularis]|uniref:NmrA-like family domain-containing protein 1 n=1 Tax=Cudoniella acicularis TaxID=354080 RepID=A0A8H4RRY4_9HELO|nr:hypothetical protein G7Y89_g4160 [Cudoniella acicularis]